MNDEESDRDMKHKIKRGQCQLVFLSPKALFCGLEWRGMLSSDVYRHNLVAFVVDEAHCVKKW